MFFFNFNIFLNNLFLESNNEDQNYSSEIEKNDDTDAGIDLGPMEVYEESDNAPLFGSESKKFFFKILLILLFFLKFLFL